MIMGATGCQTERVMQKKPRNWMEEMIDRRVLVGVPVEDTPMLVPDGVILIIDSETDPTCILQFGRKDHPVILIANEAGVLIASSDTSVRDAIEIDAESVVLSPISRAHSEGVQMVLLVVNPNSVRGIQVTMGTVELIDHMMRAGKVIKNRFDDLLVVHVVHVDHDDGTCTNYYVSAENWHDFYTTYEMEVLDRLDDSDDYEDALFGQM